MLSFLCFNRGETKMTEILDIEWGLFLKTISEEKLSQVKKI